MYLDCRMMVLGTRLFVAKEKLISAIKMSKYDIPEKVEDLKDKAETMKKERAEKKAQKAEAKKAKADEKAQGENVETFNEVDTEENKASETVETFNEVEKDKEEPEPAKAATAETTDPNAPTIMGPDFTLFNGVTYDPIVGNFVNTETEGNLEANISEAEAKELLNKMQNNQVVEDVPEMKVESAEEVTATMEKAKKINKPSTSTKAKTSKKKTIEQEAAEAIEDENK